MSFLEQMLSYIIFFWSRRHWQEQIEVVSREKIEALEVRVELCTEKNH